MLPKANTIILTGEKIEKKLLKKIETCKKYDEKGKINEIDLNAIIKRGTAKYLGPVICPNCGHRQRYFNCRTSRLIISFFMLLLSAFLNIYLFTTNPSFFAKNDDLGMLLFFLLFISFFAAIIWFFRNGIRYLTTLGVPKMRHKVAFDWLSGKAIYGKYSHDGKSRKIVD